MKKATSTQFNCRNCPSFAFWNYLIMNLNPQVRILKQPFSTHLRILLPPRNKVDPLKKFQNAVFDSFMP